MTGHENTPQHAAQWHLLGSVRRCDLCTGRQLEQPAQGFSCPAPNVALPIQVGLEVAQQDKERVGPHTLVGALQFFQQGLHLLWQGLPEGQVHVQSLEALLKPRCEAPAGSSPVRLVAKGVLWVCNHSMAGGERPGLPRQEYRAGACHMHIVPLQLYVCMLPAIKPAGHSQNSGATTLPLPGGKLNLD